MLCILKSIGTSNCFTQNSSLNSLEVGGLGRTGVFGSQAVPCPHLQVGTYCTSASLRWDTFVLGSPVLGNGVMASLCCVCYGSEAHLCEVSPSVNNNDDLFQGQGYRPSSGETHANTCAVALFRSTFRGLCLDVGLTNALFHSFLSVFTEFSIAFFTALLSS